VSTDLSRAPPRPGLYFDAWLAFAGPRGGAGSSSDVSSGEGARPEAEPKRPLSKLDAFDEAILESALASSGAVAGGGSPDFLDPEARSRGQDVSPAARARCIGGRCSSRRTVFEAKAVPAPPPQDPSAAETKVGSLKRAEEPLRSSRRGRGDAGGPAPEQGGSTLPRRSRVQRDKEKLKRAKGQSSHSAWKIEEEMALRQQYDLLRPDQAHLTRWRS